MRRVHCKQEAFDVYIGRPSIWGNPFKTGYDGTLEDVIEKYEAYVRRNSRLLARLPEIAGKTLGCWCHEFKACHGDVLVKLCEERGLI